MPVRPKGRPAKPATKATSKQRDEDDEDEYEEEDDDEEYTPPTKRSSKKRARDEDDDEYEDDDEEDEEYVPKGGWGEYKRKRAEGSNFPNNLQLGPDPQLVVFLDDEPWVTFNQHWIEREGKKSFVCLAPESDCPLCALGDGVRTINVFNVLLIEEGQEPAVFILQAGVKLSDILVKKSERAPLTKGYFSIARTGKGGNTNFDVQSVKERDLEEDFDVQPIDADVLAAAKKKKWSKEACVNRQSRKDLIAIAKELTGDYDRD